MTEGKKKRYTKPRLKAQKIELGVYGDYNGDCDTAPFLPVRDRKAKGDVDLF